jgi:hypothetical protein
MYVYSLYQGGDCPFKIHAAMLRSKSEMNDDQSSDKEMPCHFMESTDLLL